MHVGGSMAFANLLYGRLADEWSAGDIMAVAGAAFTIVVLGTIIASGFWRGIYFRGGGAPGGRGGHSGGGRLGSAPSGAGGRLRHTMTRC